MYIKRFLTLFLGVFLVLASFFIGLGLKGEFVTAQVVCSDGQLLLDGTCYDPGENGKFDWCHCGTDHCNSINVPLASLLNAGHINAAGNVLHEGDHIGQCIVEEEPEPEEPIEGCTDPAAVNFDEEATEDDGSCEYLTVLGCTDPSALNFNEEAEQDDDSCEYEEEEEPVLGISTTDVCANIDGDQATVPDGLHLDASGENCVSFSAPGDPGPGDGGGTVLGASTEGQVLGTSTLGAAGSANVTLRIIFAFGMFLLGSGIIVNVVYEAKNREIRIGQTFRY